MNGWTLAAREIGKKSGVRKNKHTHRQTHTQVQVSKPENSPSGVELVEGRTYNLERYNLKRCIYAELPLANRKFPEPRLQCLTEGSFMLDAKYSYGYRWSLEFGSSRAYFYTIPEC